MRAGPITPQIRQPAPARPGGRLLPAGVNAVGAIAAVGIAAVLAAAATSGQLQAAWVAVGYVALLMVSLIDPAHGLLLWVVMAPFYRFFTLKMGAGLPDLGLHRIMALSVLLLLLAQRAAGQRRLARPTAFEGLAGLFVVGLLLSVPASPMGLSSGIQYVFDFAALPALWFYFGRGLLGSSKGLERLSIALAIAGVGMGLIAVREQLTHEMILSPIPYHEAYGRYSVKINSLFGAAASMAMTLVMTVPAVFVGAMRARTLGRRLAWGAALTVILAGLVLTYVRAGWVAALLCLLVPLFFSARARHLALRLMPAVLVLAAIFIYGYGGADTRSFEERVQSQRPIDYRLEAIDVGLRIIARSPVLGLGLNSYSEEALESGWRPLNTRGLPVVAAHNMYIDVLTSAGLVGLLPLLGLLGLIGWRLLDLLRMRRGGDWLAAALGLLLGYVGITFAFDGLTAQLANMYFLMLIGAILGMHEMREGKDSALGGAL